MSRLKWKKRAAGKPTADFRQDGYRPSDDLQRRADAAFDAWQAKLPPAKRRGLKKRLRSDVQDLGREVRREAEERIEERIRLGPPLFRLMGVKPT